MSQFYSILYYITFLRYLHYNQSTLCNKFEIHKRKDYQLNI